MTMWMKVIVSLSSSGHTTCHASAAFKCLKLTLCKTISFSQQGLVWRSHLLLSRLYRWLAPYPLGALALQQVSLDDGRYLVFDMFSCHRFSDNFFFFFFSFFQLFQPQLQAKLWTSHLSHWPHTAFSCPTCSTHKRKDILQISSL